MHCHGTARLGKRTKELVQRVKQNDFVILAHEDIDSVAASDLARAGVSAVLNTKPSVSGRYENRGPQLLLEHGIPLIDCCEPDLFSIVSEGDELEFRNGRLFCNQTFVATGKVWTHCGVKATQAQSKRQYYRELGKFVDNTLEYMEKDKAALLSELHFPNIQTKMVGRHVVVVVRGPGCQIDLAAIAAYINEVDPVLIAVDGGADELLEFGRKPQMIIGDMDSVSDKALHMGAELLVHAYTDGRCPGKERLDVLRLESTVLSVPGTSEDVALLLASEKGADLIVAVGTHSNMVDFLEKGRKGMASTLLARLRVGAALLDAKGVSKLYGGRVGWLPLIVVIAAALPIIVFLSLASPWRHLLRSLWLQLRLALGGY